MHLKTAPRHFRVQGLNQPLALIKRDLRQRALHRQSALVNWPTQAVGDISLRLPGDAGIHSLRHNLNMACQQGLRCLRPQHGEIQLAESRIGADDWLCNPGFDLGGYLCPHGLGGRRRRMQLGLHIEQSFQPGQIALDGYGRIQRPGAIATRHGRFQLALQLAFE